MNVAIPAGLGLPELAGTQLVAFVLVLGRVGPLFTLAPVFSASLITQRAKFVVAASITLALTPIASQGQTIPTDAIGFAMALAKEVGVGLAFALALGVISAAVTAGASLLDTTVGFSYGALLDPVTGVQNAVLGQIYSLFAVMIFLTSGGVRLMILGVARTYTIVPLGTFPSPSALAAIALRSLEQVPVIGFELVAPVLLAVVVTDAAFGFLARTVPQMNVFVVAIPLKILIAFAVVAVSLPLVGLHLTDDLTNAISQTLQGLTP